MGVDFYACESCGESRYSEFVGSCTCCGNRLCTNCMTNDDVNSQYANDYGVVFDGSKKMMEEYDISQEDIDKGYYEIGELIDDTSIDPKYCPYCEGEDIDENKFLEYLIKLSGKSREVLEQEFLESK